MKKQIKTLLFHIGYCLLSKRDKNIYQLFKNVAGDNNIYRIAIKNCIVHGTIDSFKVTCSKLKIVCLDVPLEIEKAIGRELFDAIMSLPDTKEIIEHKAYRMIEKNIKRIYSLTSVDSCRKLLDDRADLMSREKVKELDKMLLQMHCFFLARVPVVE